MIGRGSAGSIGGGSLELLPATPLEAEEVAEAAEAGEAAAGDGGTPMATGVIGGDVLTA